MARPYLSWQKGVRPHAPERGARAGLARAWRGSRPSRSTAVIFVFCGLKGIKNTFTFGPVLVPSFKAVQQQDARAKQQRQTEKGQQQVPTTQQQQAQAEMQRQTMTERQQTATVQQHGIVEQQQQAQTEQQQQATTVNQQTTATKQHQEAIRQHRENMAQQQRSHAEQQETMEARQRQAATQLAALASELNACERNMEINRVKSDVDVGNMQDACNAMSQTIETLRQDETT